ncbi:cytosolic Prostaglandin E synthase-like [Anticarsia gemmatalis]|uniref:cytosolic Prostaglandin E synthase-like n=1 Tax=Anticarsia gemmatalis TaxID=129554 RepID=UPI003F76256C
MTSQLIATPPSVSWAQGSGSVFLTFNVECEKPDIKIERKAVSFEGIGKPDDKLYGVVIPLYSEIDPEKSSYTNKGRLIEVVLTKDKTNAPFWPALTSDKKKHHWLKIDFNRWQDEDESDDLDEMNNVCLDKLSMDDYGDDNEKEDSSSGEEEDLPDIEQ